jgi:high-affinity Fe2+/Pb2+ permease
VLFSVSFWLISKAESRHWTAYLSARSSAALGGRRLLVLSGLAFLAVYREAAENGALHAGAAVRVTDRSAARCSPAPPPACCPCAPPPT